MNKRTLLVILSFKLSDVIAKGELISHYFNPLDVFDEVHILLTNADQPDPQMVQGSVGRAKLFIHNYPFRPLKMLSIASVSLSAWAKDAITLIGEIKPDVVRCHGDGLNALLALRIKRSLGVPYIISLHSDPDGKPGRKRLGLVDLWLYAMRVAALTEADYVLPVYQSAAEYALRRGAVRVKVIYNTLNKGFLKVKTDYALHMPCKLLYVGRLIAYKNPQHIIEALVSVPATTLDIIGNGQLMAQMQDLTIRLGLQDRVKFIAAVRNDELISALGEYDIFVAHTEYSELPKTVMEAALVGLPVVLNRRKPTEVPEIAASPFLRVEASAQGYSRALHSLMKNELERARLGREARDYARQNWDPEASERQYAEVYKEILKLP